MEKIRVGFTGTQDGMTDKQYESVFKLLERIKNSVLEVHFGDCIGADAQFYEICKLLGLYIISHPPIKDDKRAFCRTDEECPKKEYLVRNKNIVDSSDVLIVIPKSNTEQLRSGTWSTMRYAKKKNKRIILIIPNGEIK